MGRGQTAGAGAMGMEAILGLAPVIPVVTLERAADAVPLARALVAGGLPVIEVTLRTAAGPGAIERIATEVAHAVVGAGTILKPGDVEAALRAGARFGVSPALFPETVAAAAAADLPYLPGIMTATEAMRAVALGRAVLKLFPAEPAGGVKLLKALAGPFPDLRFCPTGGIGPAQAADYLALPNVIAIGGSWLTPPELLRAQDWPAVERLARQAAALKNRR